MAKVASRRRLRPIEPLLKEYDCEFRSPVVEKHYKLIYTVTDELIEIHAVWDCR